MSIRQTIWAMVLGTLVWISQVPHKAVAETVDNNRVTAIWLLWENVKWMDKKCPDNMMWYNRPYSNVISACIKDYKLLKILRKPTLEEIKGLKLDSLSYVTENPIFLSMLIWDLKTMISNPALVEKLRKYRKMLISWEDYDVKSDKDDFCRDNDIFSDWCPDNFVWQIKPELLPLYDLVWVLDRNWIKPEEIMVMLSSFIDIRK